MNESKINIKQNNLTEVTFSELSYWFILNTNNEINSKDPSYKLLLQIDDIKTIKTILEKNKGQITKFFYFNRDKICKILYDYDEIIFLKYDDNNKNLSFYFYLLLLIKDAPDLLNFTYDVKYITEMMNIQNSNENNDDEIYKIIISKIIIELLIDFQNINDYYDEENEKKIKNNIDKNKIIIKKNCDYLNDIDINWSEKDIIEKRIDDMYIEIIVALIKKNKFGDIDNLLKKLDLENISLTEKMMEQLINVLNNNDYINGYVIKEEEDFNKNFKIHFYYNILKYLIKDEFFIYKIPFLIKTMNICRTKRKTGRKTGKNISFKNKNNILGKIKFIFLKFTGTDENIVEEKSVPNIRNILSNVSFRDSNNKLPSLNKENPEEITELNCILYIRNLLTNDKIKNDFISSIKEKNNRGIDKIIKCLKIEKNFENKFKEIINNNKFINKLENKKDLEFNNKFIKDFFYFEESLEEINDLEKNLPINSNPRSIDTFKGWIEKKEEKDKSG